MFLPKDNAEIRVTIQRSSPLLRLYKEPIFDHVSDANLRRALYKVSSICLFYLKSLAQLRGVIDDMIACRAMIGSFPWRSQSITRTQHIELHWFLFEDLCYIYREKLKRYYNNKVRFANFLSHSKPDWLKKELKLLDSELGSHIRRRGDTVHNWGSQHTAVSLFSTVAMAKSVGVELPSDLNEYESDARSELKYEARQVIQFCSEEYLRVTGLGPDICDPIVRELSEIIESIGLEDRPRSQAEGST